MKLRKICGKKCFLSPIDVADYQLYAKWANDYEIVRFLPHWYFVINSDRQKEFLDKKSKEHNYSIIDLKSDQLIGSIGFNSIDNIHRNAEIGITIGNKDFWKKGYASEAIQLLTGYGFNSLNLNSIKLEVYSTNKAAIDCYLSNGFKQAGSLRQSIYFEGKYIDLIIMDIIKDDYITVNNRDNPIMG